MTRTALDPITPYLGDIDAMLHFAGDAGKEYAQPALRNLGSVAIPILREVISPASFRNQDQEVTDIEAAGIRRVRAVANKFKHGERARGLQILRNFSAGGRSPQNRTGFRKNERPSAAFDLNTIVFGDSANHGSNVLPVKAAAQYSDAISLTPYADCVDETFHNRAAEDGSLFDPETKKNSTNIFERHFVKPGTLLLQVIAFNGCTAPVEALEHLLLSIGLAGAYGGQTSIYGINVRNHVVGLYGAKFEREIASPYVAAERIGTPAGAREAVPALRDLFAGSYATAITGADIADLQHGMIALLEADDAGMHERYRATHDKVGDYFDTWFEGHGGRK